MTTTITTFIPGATYTVEGPRRAHLVDSSRRMAHEQRAGFAGVCHVLDTVKVLRTSKAEQAANTTGGKHRDVVIVGVQPVA